MFFKKGSGHGFFNKGFGQKLLGGAKRVAGVLDNDITNGIVSLVAPEIGIGLAAARKTGILEKIKNS